MEMLDLIAGLAWDPEIRGFLAVLAMAVTLMGSVWLLLSSNSGPRLGTLLALAALFGWMAIMGSIWWIYGIGWAGDAPTWVEVEIVEGTDDEGRLTYAALDEANILQAESLPTAHEIVVDAGAAAESDYGSNWLTMGTGGLTSDEVAHLGEVQTAWLEFGTVTADTLTADQTEGLSDAEIDDLAAEEQSKNEATTLSELAAVAPGIIDPDADELGGWTLLSTAESGEAQASAIAIVLESNDFSFGSQVEFKLLDAFTIGGKEGLPDDPNVWDRVWTKVRQTAQITHPTRYGIVQLQQVTEESITNLPGTAPQRPVVDTEEPVVSVVMIRDLGNVRFRPAMVTIGSLLIFFALCYMLHERDKLVMARRAEFEGA
ncbi:MAG: hypothetical protein P8I99_00615 [Acidimicrobiales bacterium]|nr:hypothetical protein [Acidimicrobiales bacterium]